MLTVVALLVACKNENNISARIEAPPEVVIQGPDDGFAVDNDDVVEFIGVVADGNGLDDIAALSWSSDRDGDLADMDLAPLDADGITRFGTTLSPGVHAITLTAVDSTDRRAQQSISVVVSEVNTAPFAEITSPAAFARFNLGSDITLVGGVSDPNQPPEQLVATWSWELESGGAATEIPTGRPSTTGTVLGTWTTPPKGDYRLRLAVVDGEGQRAEAQVVVSVFDPNEDDQDLDGWTRQQGDCNDLDASVNPAALEACNDVDDDCNNVVDDKDVDVDLHVDEDCVRYMGPLPVDDCDDADGSTYSGAAEQLDGADNDCNGVVDDGLSSFDADGDCACTAANCTGSANPACADVEPGDCDDADPDLHPFDDDGDGSTPCGGDCDDTDPALNGLDLDRDGATTCEGDCNDLAPMLTPFDVDGDGFSSCGGDCDDTDISVSPLDVDGDGLSGCAGDCDDTDPDRNRDDADADGYDTCAGDCDDTDADLTPVDADADGLSTCGGDCDDSSPLLNQLDGDGDGWTTCDGDCNDASTALNLRDADGDGSSTCGGDCDDNDPSRSGLDADGDGYSTCAGDCDDGDDQLSPRDGDGDGFSTCTGDCDDADPGLEPDDADNDGYSTCGGDCDDALFLANPGRTEVPYNGVDDDCLGGDEVDVDNDGYVATQAGGNDCADSDPLVYPGRTEACNNKDDDCDGTTDEPNATGCTPRYTDVDGDGWGVGASQCTCAASGNVTATQAGDCYDANADAHPDQTNWYVDHRGDGSWDYDCDGVELLAYYDERVWDCDLCGFLNTSCCYDVGWVGGRPDCGQTAEFNYGCYWVPAISCDPHNSSYDIYTQSCQ